MLADTLTGLRFMLVFLFLCFSGHSRNPSKIAVLVQPAPHSSASPHSLLYFGIYDISVARPVFVPRNWWVPRNVLQNSCGTSWHHLVILRVNLISLNSGSWGILVRTLQFRTVASTCRSTVPTYHTTESMVFVHNFFLIDESYFKWPIWVILM